MVVAPPQRERRQLRVERRPVLVGTGIVVAVALLAAVLLLRDGSDGTRFDHERALADVGRSVVVTADGLREARTLAALRTEAEDAADPAEDIEIALADADRIGNDDDRRAVRQALEASQAVLAGYAALGDLTPQQLDEWPSLRTDLSEAASELAAADRALSATELPGLGTAVLESTSATIDDLNGVVEGAQVQLRDWQAEVDRIEGQRAMGLAALGAYEQAFRGHDARYTELRKDLQDFVDRVDANGASYGEAYSTLSQATTQREEIRNAMRAMVPPSALATTHAGVIAVLDEAIGAMRSASEGVRQYEYSWEYWYYKDTPGWQTFMSASSGITGAHDTAFRAWEAAVAAERARIEATASPPAPAV